MQLPDFVLALQDKALLMVQKGLVGDFIFSKGTYEVQVKGPTKKDSYWPFLKLDDFGNILDCFCTCEASEKEKGCIHLATAYLSVVSKNKPLHVRFEKSFWNQFCQILALEIGYDSKALKKDKNGFSSKERSKIKKPLFSITFSKKDVEKKLTEIFSKKISLDENSFEFSQLSSEQILQYKQKKASHDVCYLISFWIDLAKYLFLRQERKEKYRLEFEEKENSLPQKLFIIFDDLKIECSLSIKQLQTLIPSLKTTNCNLQVFEEEAVEKITYDPIDKSFYIHEKKKLAKPHEVAPWKVLDQWYYEYKKGFFLIHPKTVFDKKKIPKEEVSSYLSNYTHIFEKYLENAKVHLDPIKANYQLFFDGKQSLHIRLYVFEIKDLQKDKNSHFFGPWVYLEEKGFYQLEDILFDSIDKTILKEDIADFIDHNRSFLFSIEGFQTHMGSFSSYLTFDITSDQFLRFSSKIDLPKGYDRAIDLGRWIYIFGKGFYTKKEKASFLSLRAGLSIEKDNIANFISTHKDQLEDIPGFFSHKNPIEKIGVDLHVNEYNLIVVTPKIEIDPAYQQKKILFFENYVYVPEDGFFYLPPSMLLPEKYQNKTIIARSQEAYFLSYELENLKKIALYTDPKLEKPISLHLSIRYLEKEEKKGISYYVADLFYESEKGKISVFDLYQALIEEKRYLFSNAGLLDLKEFRFKWLLEITSKRIVSKQRFLKFNILQWIRLFLFDDLKEPKEDTIEANKIRALLHELYSFETDHIFDLELLKADLRIYQSTGSKWLWFLYCHGLSGLLCDEMGLGKTHQAMALLAGSSSEDVEKKFKYLIVCPTSVMYHWQELLKTFVPHFRVLMHHGSLRSLDGFEEEYDILLTSYGILRAEKKLMQKMHFEIAIYDEVQIAKNPASKTHESLKIMNARMKLGLTGTPIENRLLELKALFDLILPSYLPSDSIFREVFINPIEKYKDKKAQEQLSRVIRPFILRRKKAEVLLELPEKIEEIAYCDLSEEQLTLYNDEIKKSKEPILKDLEDQKKPIPFMHVFALLSRLKQICDHPSVILKDKENFHQHTSGKWELFEELLNETRESGQKLVVFSQYLDMLSIIERYLKHNKIGYASIRGSTKDRQEQIKRFKKDPNCEVFVASLLAAGLGIDLSCASVVIHYDRWWNPAKENQATDRVHRIGQSRGVQVFKLVTKNTIEENIHRLIEKKRGLIEETIGKDDSEQVKSFSREELLDILRKIELS